MKGKKILFITKKGNHSTSKSKIAKALFKGELNIEVPVLEFYR
jgi:hypothetical protein